MPLLKLHAPVEALGWNFYALVNFDDIGALTDVGAAARAEIVFSVVELAFSGAYQRNKPFKVGVDVSADFLGFDVRAETSIPVIFSWICIRLA